MNDDFHSRQRHERVKELLFEVLEEPPVERVGFLRTACGDDEELWREARSLLARMTELDGFLEAPLDFGGAVEPDCPERLGRFRIHRLLGFGGMGVVYLAEEKSPPRLVALKALRIETASEPMRKRFQREAEALARFSHPGIARVYSAEVVETHLGMQPIISMEYVDGESIIEAACAAGLDQRGRVELIVEVAEAVEHAHQAGVLHRDLKPDNVLVGSDGRARILDFGVAHVVGSDVSSLHTQTGQVLGTVVYMSPEQARGGRATARSDQFSLAVILYELLCGHLPFETRDQLVHDALSSLADGVWVPPSVYESSLRGDLETVLAKALESNPARRYASVADFAADLKAWLGGRPIAARPPSRRYQLGMLIKRNRAMSASLVAIVLALLVGTGVAVYGITRAWSEASMATLFSQREQLDALVAEADELWPADSIQAAAMEQWLARAQGLVAGLEQRRAFLAELESGPLPAYGDYDGSWLTNEARRLVRDLEKFTAPGGTRSSIAVRATLAKGLWKATVERFEGQWQAVRARVHSSVGAAFDLPPQEGLVPLGPDPDSGLEEFALLTEGRQIPWRGAAGSLEIGDDSCLVFVLIPGGSVLVGAQQDDPTAPRFDPLAFPPPGDNGNEGPPCELELDPYLISKYELTQGQWLAAFGDNPSDLGIGSQMRGFVDVDGQRYTDEVIGARNPVESVTWLRAMEELPKLGLCLPTEAQWEHAARGGAESAYPHGDDPLSMVGRANFHVLEDWEIELRGGVALPFDGFRYHAPVGSFAPNGYGLFDVLGNVWELCLDTYKVYYHTLEHRPGDGLVLAEPDGDISRRGGGFWMSPLYSRVTCRQMLLQGDMNSSTGLRPVRPLRFSGSFASQSTSPARHGE